jgi:hypothetical protein
MTKKHFEWAAKYVRSISDPNEREHVTGAYAEMFAQFNPRFNRGLFWAACRGEDFFDGRITHRYSNQVST